MALALIVAALWLVFVAVVLARVRLPRELPAAAVVSGERDVESVSVIIPARNEHHNIIRVLNTVTASSHPDFEVIVVDDRSEDDTGALARSVGPGRARALRVIDGAEPPAGWLGKPWACHQGAALADGRILLFTDADTVHGPHLLSRAVRALDEDRANALTVLGRQLMESFWERLIQPQVFVAILLRFPDQRRPRESRAWRSAIANGQYLMMRRAAYDRIGGHESVRGEVVEDLRLAQRLVRGGERLTVRGGENDLATHMYRSLGDLVEGWSKNALLGARASLPPGLLRHGAPLAMLLSGLMLWLVPPVTLVAALAGAGGQALLAWSSAATLIGALFWAGISWRTGAPARYGLLFPLGSAVTTWIFLRSWIRGRSVEWKGRRYEVSESGEGEELEAEAEPDARGAADP